MQPDDFDALLDRANRLLEEGQPEDSLRCLDEIPPDELENDDRVEWAALRAWALTELGRDDEALETLEPMLGDHPQSARLLGTLGVVLSNRDELDDAREALEEALELDPEDEVAIANLALVFEKLRDYDRALELYDQALERGADLDWVLQRRATVCTELGSYKEAKATLRRYLSLAPDDASQWISLALLHSDDGEFADAFGCYEQAERVNPDEPSLRLHWGLTAVRAQRLRVARTQLRHLQRVEPRSARPDLLRASILEEEGHLAAARQIYERVLARQGFNDRGELTHVLEMAMEFFARHRMRPRCERLVARAYAENACTVELCDAYRESIGEYVRHAYWYSIVMETDARPGLLDVTDADLDGPRFTRLARVFQVVARNHDDATGLTLEFARKMGERNPSIREFVGEETIEDTYTGIYEVEPDSFVVSDESAEQ